MSELDDRLIRCFSAEFPYLTIEEISAARIGAVQGWDSLATVTLFALIEEEFGIEINLEHLPELTFGVIQNYLSQHIINPTNVPDPHIEAD
jgi:acyl carrier protein